MIRFLCRILGTPSSHLLHKNVQWDLNMNENGGLKTWSSEVKEICEMHGISQIYQQQSTFSVKSVVDNLKISMLRKQQQLVEQECRSKPKLRTFNTFKDFTSMPPHVAKPLSFIERKMLTSPCLPKQSKIK